MANQLFVNTQTREKEIKSLFFNVSYAPTSAEATLETTTPIVLSTVDKNSLQNGYTFDTTIAAAAANPTDTVLAEYTGTAAAIALEITPNDGTNNPTTQASGSLGTSVPVVMTKTLAARPGVIGNGDTLTLTVNAAAANPTDTVLANFGGVAGAITLGITPNDGTNNPTTQASGSLGTSVPIVLTKTVAARPGVVGNGDTLTLTVNAAAANPGDTILALVGGVAAAITLAITPNDGTNNGAVPVNLTTAELAELITTGAVVGKTVTVTDVGGLLNDQTATGGDATNLANGGEGDGEVATFANGANTAINLTTAELAELITTGVVVGKTVTITDVGGLRNDQTAVGGDATNLANGGEGDGEVVNFANGANTAVTLTTAELAELIDTGAVAGKTVTITDVGGLKALNTATGGDATDVVNGGEGDGLSATFAGATDFTSNNSVGFNSFELLSVGKLRARLDDKWIALRGAAFTLLDSTARDFTFQIAGYDMNPGAGANAYIDIFTLTSGVEAELPVGAKLMGTINLKNTSTVI